jgi:hypothetical protein
MDDPYKDLPRESPRFWVALGIFAVAFAIAVVMSVVLTVKAHAQEKPLCGPAEILLRQFSEIHKERVIWEGVVPQENGAIELILMQGEKNTWTLFSLQGSVNGLIACIVASGRDANPSLADKGV